MNSLIQTSKRWFLWGFVTLSQLVPAASTAAKATISAQQMAQIFSQIWWTNRTQIVALTAINTTLTTTNQYLSRTVFASVGNNKENNKFIIKAADGSRRIHRQSLISILMTIFASILGGPVFFIKKRRHRFLFFLGFGGLNSLVSQLIVGSIAAFTTTAIFSRIMFDLIYCSTLKFPIFEAGRRPIIQSKKYSIIWFVRIIQDFTMTSAKVILLNIMRFAG